MTVTELKKKLELLERNNLGDIEVYFSIGLDHRGNEEVFKVETIHIDNQLPVIIMDGFPMDDEMMEQIAGDCDEEFAESAEAQAEETKMFLECLDVNDRDEITDGWTPKGE